MEVSYTTTQPVIGGLTVLFRQEDYVICTTNVSLRQESSS